MAMGKRIVSALLCVFLLCLCAGCGGYKEGQSFTALLPQNIFSLDPQTATGEASGMVLDSLFEGLCRIDEKGETVPGVARRWESNEDATEFTFHLRPRAQWSDGTPRPPRTSCSALHGLSSPPQAQWPRICWPLSTPGPTPPERWTPLP